MTEATEDRHEPVYGPEDGEPVDYPLNDYPLNEHPQLHTVSCGCRFEATSPDRDAIIELLEGHACPLPSMARPPRPQTWHESLSDVLVALVIGAAFVAVVALVTGHVPW